MLPLPMPPNPLRYTSIALALGCVALAPTAFATNVSGRASVVDGDKLESRGQCIRLHGIDAPEAAQECRRQGQPWRCG